MKRVLAATVGLIAAVGILSACSDDGSSSDSSPAATPAASTAQTGGTEISTTGNTEVKVEGKDLAGVDLDSVTCVKQAGKINVASGSSGGQQGVAVVMTDEATPKVESLGLVVDGSALAVSNSMGMAVGSAEVSVDGDTYTITGEAEGADMKNPTAGMVKKEFTIKVTCN
ncbi:lipoprotein LpqH [Williamsia limnetica]|jgi:lipoprotein LpqH|uniref:Lipoprotein LpqH n=1 Tax=Williamsia limnetica TaxID=882452 RepID=A0A318RIA7_WILLI|nr:lipoprotein LpqH [Williamsia limnetica]PYE13149.1 lipoprotein LpqH [Williamsia limnetica]